MIPILAVNSDVSPAPTFFAVAENSFSNHKILWIVPVITTSCSTFPLFSTKKDRASLSFVSSCALILLLVVKTPHLLDTSLTSSTISLILPIKTFIGRILLTTTANIDHLLCWAGSFTVYDMHPYTVQVIPTGTIIFSLISLSSHHLMMTSLGSGCVNILAKELPDEGAPLHNCFPILFITDSVNP